MKSTHVAFALVVALVIGRMHAKDAESRNALGGGSARKLADWVATRPGGARRATLDVPVDVGVAEPLVKKHHLHPRVVVVKEQSPVPVKKEVIVKQSPVVVKQKPVVQKVQVPLIKHPFFHPIIAKKGGLFG